MIYLSIETCFSMASISIFKNGSIYTKTNQIPSSQSDSLSNMVQNLLEELNIKANQIHSVIANKGPGSFTGVRVGLSFIEGFCFDKNIKKLYLSSFGAILGNLNTTIKSDKNVLVVLKAMKDTFYIQEFSSILDEISAPIFISLADLKKMLTEKDFLLLGNFKEYDFNKEVISNCLEINSEGLMHSFLRNKKLIQTSCEPLYIRNAVNL
jgi:tRNA threonylcarbamoyladenosine biosynthesis protein TsaB